MMRTIDRHAGQPKVGIEFLARQTGLTEDATREVLRQLHPLYVSINALPGDGQALLDVRVQLTDYGRLELS